MSSHCLVLIKTKEPFNIKSILFMLQPRLIYSGQGTKTIQLTLKNLLLRLSSYVIAITFLWLGSGADSTGLRSGEHCRLAWKRKLWLPTLVVIQLKSWSISNPIHHLSIMFTFCSTEMQFFPMKALQTCFLLCGWVWTLETIKLYSKLLSKPHAKVYVDYI